jgi:hypothetical protein
MQRKARHGAVIPADAIAAEEAEIRQAVAAWCEHWHPDGFGPEASHRLLELMYLRRMRPDNAQPLDAAFVVDIALGGHPPAAQALQRLIDMAIERDLFQSLPVSVRDYARRTNGRPPPSGYPTRTTRIVDHFLRDAALCVVMRKVKARWPRVPMLNSNARRLSVAALVGPRFGLSERQARKVYQSDGGSSQRVAEFMLGSRPFDSESKGSGLKELGGP